MMRVPDPVRVLATLVLEDIDRIEVIRGPGGTLWGANAVNGIVNIITSHSAATQGLPTSVGSGTEERGMAALYGGAIGSTFTYRVYGKVENRDEALFPNW